MASDGNRTALVTGGASGLGLTVVKHLLQHQWNVTIFDFDATAGKREATRLGEKVLFIQGDVTDYQSQARAFRDTFEKWGRIDLVFANAGISEREEFASAAAQPEATESTTPDTSVIDVCLVGVAYSAKLALQYFRKRPSSYGRLVVTSIQAGIYSSDTHPLYSAAKFGAVALVRGLSKRLRKSGENISANVICPGLVDTAMTAGPFIDNAPAEMIVPPSLVVQVIQSFLDDESITGQAVEISGSELIYRTDPEYANAAAEYVLGGGYSKDTSPEDLIKFSQRSAQPRA
ncbi:hypothetical protein AYO20_07888 [Fonsecaea nubica]|uniref:Uncharacterized protein n=1 Tax=Fonsecaea nubica TaxID=856822 RepID=A0A178CRV9_9EURO|nr:hypothetical protein AYO20_07888 [Fonsecaea nubica]OAL32578.1 hypothetical protein AYO20_07888 [Fonsecaea nubica]